jgi:hypothetical protein
MKFEMEFGYFSNNKIVIETSDFDIISIFQEFVDFQEEHGWGVTYEATEELDLEDEEEDTEEELEGSESDK